MNLKRPRRESFELRHEVVRNQRLTYLAIPLALCGGVIVAVGFSFFYVCNLPGRTGNLLFISSLGMPLLLWGLFACRSSMDRETVSIGGSPLKVHVRRFLAPRRIAFDSPRVKVLQEGLYSASDIEWISVDLGTTSDEGDTPAMTDRPTSYYWHPIIKPKDLPPKELGTFCIWRHNDDESFKDAFEQACALGQKVASALKVPFLWDECPVLKNDPSYAASLYRRFSKRGWPWPWSVPTEAPARPFWKLWLSS